MADRLTDKTEKTGSFAEDDLIHVVDISDTSDNASGSSFKVKLLNLFASFTWIPLGNFYMVHKRNPSPNNGVIQDGDWFIYMNQSRLVVGIAKDTMTVVGDLDDNTKCSKYIDASPII